ncbi:MAG TPA: hypothetical protein PKX07_22200, partial [Aggregatilineales bacterium]|nr:hypothetical protein [Aggregatilineales bacterium]
DEAVPDERALEGMLRDRGVQPAMNAAERMATERGFLDPHRADARIFFRDDAPEDPFTTERQRERDTPSYVVNAISADGDPFLDVLKLWGDDYARLVVPQPDWDSARDTALAAGDLLNVGRLQDALRLVEVATVDAGVIAPDRADPRLFTEGPPDPFITIRQEQLVKETIITMSSDYDTEEIPVEPPVTSTPSRPLTDADIAREGRDALHGAAWFEATFAHSETELLEPLDDTVNYALQLQSYQPYSVDLTVDKYWREPDGALGWESVHMETYEVWRREEAQQDYDRLRDLYDARGLEALMHQAELTAMKHGTLDSDRADLPLFSDGPPDRFESLAQQLDGEINPYWNPEADLLEIPAFVADNPYWRMQTLPVSDPDGQPLGHALQMIVYPGVEHDPEQAEPPALAADEPFRMLEFAHFRTPAEADKFVKEFEGYLVPGLLDGPELAE